MKLTSDSRVRLVEPFELVETFDWRDDPDFKIAFKTCDITYDMLIELEKWDTQDIYSIDENGDIKFYDFEGTWPKETCRHIVDNEDSYIADID